MSTEENKALVRRWYAEVLNPGNLDRAGEFVATDMIDHSPGVPQGLEGVKQALGGHRAAFPDLQITVDDQIAEGDMVVNRITARGTHQGPFMGIPPTGKPFTLTAFAVVRIADGKFVERWSEADTLRLLQQLGITSIPQPPQQVGA